MSELRPRVILADDHDAVRKALVRLLARSCDVVGYFADGSSLLEAAIQLRPDVIVLDLHMPPGLNGLEACRRVRELMPMAKVIILTAADDDALRSESFKAGASAIVLKHSVVDCLLPAILGLQSTDGIEEPPHARNV